MKKYLNNLKQAGEHIRLSAAEKQAIRARLMQEFRVPSGLTPAPSPYFFFSFQFTRVLMPALALILVVGVGTASASVAALPGDLLYPIKVGVTEKIEGSLAVSEEAKAEWHTEVAERRLQEAQALAAVGKLDATVAAELETNFNEHATQAEALAVAIEEKSPGVAAQVKAKFASAIGAHTAVLARLGDQSGSITSKENSEGLAVRVLARASGGIGARSVSFAKMESVNYAADSAQGTPSPSTMSLTVPNTPTAVPTSPDPTQTRLTKQAEDKQQKIAAEIEHKAAETLADVRKTLAENKLALDATTTVQVEKELAVADSYMSEGSASLGRGEAALAREQFTAALETVVRLQALLKVQNNFEQNIISPLLNVETTDSSESAVEVKIDIAPIVPNIKISL